MVWLKSIMCLLSVTVLFFVNNSLDFYRVNVSPQIQYDFLEGRKDWPGTSQWILIYI